MSQRLGTSHPGQGVSPRGHLGRWVPACAARWRGGQEMLSGGLLLGGPQTGGSARMRGTGAPAGPAKSFKRKGTPGFPEGIQSHISGLWEETELLVRGPETPPWGPVGELRLPLSAPARRELRLRLGRCWEDARVRRKLAESLVRPDRGAGCGTAPAAGRGPAPVHGEGLFGISAGAEFLW